MVKVPSGGKWLKAADLKPGDKVKILTEANWEESTYKGETHNQFVCDIDYHGDTRKLKLTMTSCREIAPIYGDDSADWVNKELALESVKVMVGGQVRYSILASPINGQEQTKNDEPIAWDD